MNYGITSAGFVRKPYLTCLSEIQTRMQDSDMFGSEVDLSDVQPHGIFSKLMAFSEDRMWQELEAAYYSLWISSAEGVSLDRAVRFGFIERKDPYYATVTLEFEGDAGSSAETIQAETAQSIVFQAEDVTIGEDGTVSVTAKCTVSGSAGIVAANTITKIKTPKTGFTSVNNPERSENGRAEESDIELRERYDELPQATGSSVPAIKAALLDLDGVTSVIVAENTTLATDSNGLPPISIEAVIDGGDDDEIAEVLLAKAAIKTYGTTTVSIEDSQGITRQMSFSRASDISVYVRITVTQNDDWSSSNEVLLQRACVEHVGGVDDELTEHDGVGVAGTTYAWKIETLLDDISGMDDVTVELSTDQITYSRKLEFLNRQRPTTEITAIEVIYEQ